TDSQRVFPFDEAGNILYYEVVEVPDNNLEELKVNAKSYLKENLKLKDKKFEKLLTKKNSYFEFDNKSNTFKSKKDYVVYPGKFLKHAKGSVTYKVVIALKAKKYRYYFTDFVFHPFELNRYGKYAPVAGKSLPLNKPNLQKEILKENECIRFENAIHADILELKAYMSTKELDNKVQKKDTVKIMTDW
ncbi:MAG: hypothetical protein AAGI07_16185, partial [Bacteroidota bacterium]